MKLTFDEAMLFAFGRCTHRDADALAALVVNALRPYKPTTKEKPDD